MNNTKGVDIMKENKKSFKEFVEEHKHQIITGAACVTTGVVIYLLFKEVEKNNELLNENKIVTKLQETVDVIQEAMSEGMVQEAIATTTRKLNNRLDIISRLSNKENMDFTESEKLAKALEDSKVFERRLKAFNKLADKYTIE